MVIRKGKQHSLDYTEVYTQKLCFTEHKYHPSTEIDCMWDTQEDTSYRVLVLHASVNVHVQLLHMLGKVLDEYGPPIQWWPYYRWAEVRETTEKVLNSVRTHNVPCPSPAFMVMSLLLLWRAIYKGDTFTMTSHLQCWHIYNDITFTMMSHLQWCHIYNDVTFTMMSHLQWCFDCPVQSLASSSWMT